MHVQPPHRDDAAALPHATRCAASGISLPTHEGLTETDVDRVCRTLIGFLDQASPAQLGRRSG